MKKKISGYLFTAACATMLLVSCGKDDNSSADVKTVFSGQSLTLNYSGDPMPGKEVRFETPDYAKGTFTLYGIVPGETNTVFSDVDLISVNDGKRREFSGSANTADRNVEYDGFIQDGKLNLNLAVEFPDNVVTGTWNLAPLTVVDGNIVSSSPVHMVLQLPAGSAPDAVTNAQYVQVMAQGGLGAVLASCFKSITFHNDGNVTVRYAPMSGGAAAVMNIMSTFTPVEPEAGAWRESPFNVCQYYVRDGKLYLLPVNMDLSQIMGSKASITGAIARITQWMKTGVPLIMDTANGLEAYLVRSEIAEILPLLPMLSSMLPDLGSPELNQAVADLITKASSALDAATLKTEIGVNLRSVSVE